MATLSRGYGRNTKGYVKVQPQMTAQEVGDEPLQFAKKFSKITVAVAESRQKGIAKLLEETPQPELIILDDAFQHRKVKAGFYMLLTSYDSLYSNEILVKVKRCFLLQLIIVMLFFQLISNCLWNNCPIHLLP